MCVVTVKSHYTRYNEELEKMGICKKRSKKERKPPRKKVKKKYIFYVSKTNSKRKAI